MSSIRTATHAGSWYSQSRPSHFPPILHTQTDELPPFFVASKLDAELTSWLSLVKSSSEQPLKIPLSGCHAIIAPFVEFPSILEDRQEETGGDDVGQND